MWLWWILPRGDSSRIPNHPRRWIALHGAIMAALDMWTVWLQVVQLWRKELSKINPKAAESLADPAQYKNLFPNIDLALKAEQLQARTFFTFCLSQSMYAGARSNTDLLPSHVHNVHRLWQQSKCKQAIFSVPWHPACMRLAQSVRSLGDLSIIFSPIASAPAPHPLFFYPPPPPPPPAEQVQAMANCHLSPCQHMQVALA